MNRAPNTTSAIRRRTRALGALATSILFFGSASAQQPMPLFEFARLFQSAEAIAVLELTADETPELVPGSNGRIAWTLETSLVREVAGGPLPSRPALEITTLARPFAGGGTLEQGDHVLAFLDVTPSGAYELVSANYGIMRVSWLRSLVVTGQTSEQIVLAELLRALDDPDPDVKIASLRALEMIRDRSAQPYAERLSSSPDDRVVAHALALRFALGDPTPLEAAVRLIHESARLERGEKDLLAWSFSRVPGLSVETLNRILRDSPDPTLGTVAAYVLATDADRSSLPALIAGLERSERETQYRCVIALSRLAHRSGPSHREFMANPEPTLAYWRARWERAERSRKD